MIEKPCQRGEARAFAESALASGAVGAVTSWGSGIGHRETLRLFYDAATPGLEALLGEDLNLAEDLVEEDWGHYWRASLKPFAAGASFVLAPAWDEGRELPGTTLIRIDPGMAFGAGDHPTTRLCVACLEALSATGFKGARMLDVGAGTGILALVAARLGIGPVDALDIDPFCYSSIRRNTRLNHLEPLVRPLLLSLDLLNSSYPLVVANVAPNQLEAMALTLAESVMREGLLLISGFTVDIEERLSRTFMMEFRPEKRYVEGEWIALAMRRLC